MPEPTSSARAQGFNKVVVDQFFDLLTELQTKHHYSPDRVYNCDETGFTTVPNRPSKVIAARGKKQVGSLSSAERGQLVTVEICMSASGNFIPPMFVFPRCRMKPELLDAAPPGSIGVAHPSGWMQTDLFLKWFEHFVYHSHSCADSPVLLILDGHKTHTLNLDVINLAREKCVSLLCLPSHCSHRLQPLDVSLMKPLSTYYTQEVEKWLLVHPGRIVTTLQLPALFREAYLRAASALTAVNGFRKTGIWPINRDVFQDADFAASLPTDIPRLEHEATGSNTELVAGEVSPTGEYVELIIEKTGMPIEILQILVLQSQPLIRHIGEGASQPTSHESGMEQLDDVDQLILQVISPITMELTEGQVGDIASLLTLVEPVLQQPGGGDVDSLVSPTTIELIEAQVGDSSSSPRLVEPVLQKPCDADGVGLNTPTAVGCRNALEHKPKVRVLQISPLPKVEVSSIRKTSKSKGKTAILTASPYKQGLETKKRLAEEKIAAMEAKKVKKALAAAEKNKKTSKTKEKKPKYALNTNQKRGVKQTGPIQSVCPECGIMEKSVEDKVKACDWISCKTCLTWYHESCAEVNGVFDDDYFLCVQCCE
nr:uncharacterized protein LOC124806949 [Hydra vulgaris]